MAVLQVSPIEIGWYEDSSGFGRRKKRWHSGCAPTGAVSVRFSFQNTGDREIQSASFFLLPYNGQDEPVHCQRKGVSTVSYRCGGPWKPGSTCQQAAGDLWYNPSILRVALRKITVEYTDGGWESLEGPALDPSLYRGRVSRWTGFRIRTFLKKRSHHPLSKKIR